MEEQDPAEVKFGCLHILVGSSSCAPRVKVGSVINCAAEIPNLPFGSSTLRLEWKEVRGELLSDVEPKVLQFCRDRCHEPILIHCAAGKVVPLSVVRNINPFFFLFVVALGLRCPFGLVPARKGFVEGRVRGVIPCSELY